MSPPPDDPSPPSWEQIEAQYHARADRPSPTRSRRARRRRVRNLVEWIVALAGALLVAWFIQAFLVQAFVIPSASMEPTLADRDRVLVNKQSYGSRGPSRGDVVVFSRPPGVELEAGIDDLIKRVVAVGGETVEARLGLVHINGSALDEPYLPEGQLTEDFGPIVVPEGHVFVLGDNRGPAMSLDSRFFGAVDNELVIGRAFMVIWPPSRLSTL